MQLHDFADFETKLYEHNEQKNLTSVPQNEAWLRHFADCLLYQDLIPKNSSVLDVGTGPGFPAWPLACARPDLKITALDSNGKMLDFLRSVIRPNITIRQTRAEDKVMREAFDIVTGRAVAPLAVQLEISAPSVKVGGAFIPMRTLGVEFELRDLAQIGLELEEVVIRELADAKRAFPIYRKVTETPHKYPRRWSEIKAKPIE